MKAKKILIVVADQSQARFYLANGPKHPIMQLEVVDHPNGRLKDYDLSSKSHDVTTVPFEDRDSKKEHEKAHFAKQLVSNVDKYLRSEGMQDLFIFAPPKMIGLINKSKFPKNVNVREINKDFVKAEAKDLYKMIHDRIYF